MKVKNFISIAFSVFVAGIFFYVIMIEEAPRSNQGDLHDYALNLESLPSLHLEELTWPEVGWAIKSGKTGVIIPTGGVEQNGPHVVLGKHNYIVRHAAESIAEELGDTLVAPVVSYVPEGSARLKTGHMRFPGTISVSEETFKKVLSETIESLIAHGFNRVYLLGDSGGNQAVQMTVAKSFSKKYESMGIVVLHVSDYYSANGQIEWLKEKGFREMEIGTHAGIRDTSELWALKEKHIRENQLRSNGGGTTERTGVSGDPTKASSKLGKEMLKLKIWAALNQIRKR